MTNRTFNLFRTNWRVYAIYFRNNWSVDVATLTEAFAWIAQASIVNDEPITRFSIGFYDADSGGIVFYNPEELEHLTLY